MNVEDVGADGVGGSVIVPVSGGTPGHSEGDVAGGDVGDRSGSGLETTTRVTSTDVMESVAQLLEAQRLIMMAAQVKMMSTNSVPPCRGSVEKILAKKMVV